MMVGYSSMMFHEMARSAQSTGWDCAPRHPDGWEVETAGLRLIGLPSIGPWIGPLKFPAQQDQNVKISRHQ